jgi:membrane protease subunit HflK
MHPEPPNPVVELFDKIRGRVRGKAALGLILVVIVISGVSGSVYTVPADAEAVVLRFGRFSHTAKSGLHFKIPYGVDRKEIVPVKRQLKVEFGFATPGATDPFQASEFEDQRLARSMITGDRNAATVEWVVQYRIESPRDYLFKVRNPKATLRDCSESVMREVVGDRSVDEVITIGRQQIESVSLTKLQDLVNQYELGLRIDQVQLKNVNPPEPVKRSFNEVNRAQQEREQSINVARGEYNKLVPRTRGEADRTVAEAEGSATKRINEALGDANRFSALYAEFSKAPAVTRERLYLEAMQEVLPRLERKVLVDEDASGVLPLLHLGEGEGINKSGRK